MILKIKIYRFKKKFSEISCIYCVEDLIHPSFLFSKQLDFLVFCFLSVFF